MSAGMGIYRDELDVSYAVDFGRDREPTQKRSRHPEYRRKGSAPARVNGLHCRRNKRWTWGSGRGARMQNLRAFAGCLAFAVASLAANAFGVPISYNFVGNPGNTGNPASNPAGRGAVSDVFKMATTETTNAQYVAFLNSVDPNGTNPNSIYNANMGSNVNGGILFSGGAGTGAKYSVKSGAPAGAPGGTSYGTMPVNFVTWFSAARFVNWLNNGATGTSSTETGAYTLANAVSGPIVARNPGATASARKASSHARNRGSSSGPGGSDGGKRSCRRTDPNWKLSRKTNRPPTPRMNSVLPPPTSMISTGRPT